MEISDDFNIPVNEFQTPINKKLMDSLPEELQEQLLDFIDNVEFIKRLISPDRKRAKDLPRDNQGRIKVDITRPHILEDMDYFRPAAIHYQQNGCYTFLRPNPNPNSEYRKWLNEELRRCREGYVRESDGEWVTGYMYWFLNYCPIMLTKINSKTLRADRVRDFPRMFEGIYWRSHYLYQAREQGKHAAELARRGAGKSFYLASMMAKNLIIGESSVMKRDVTTILTAYAKEFLSDKDGTLSKFEPMVDFVRENTEFPRLLMKRNAQDMFWQMGYINDRGIKKGSLNSVMGVSSKDDVDKLRGKRGFIYFEEFGNFPGLLDIYNTVRAGLEDGIYAFGQAYMIGTANNKEANFDSAKSLLYEPDTHRILSLDNVFDKPKQGKPKFAFFFPAYINREGCYNKDGVSDVVAALVEILKYRYEAKYSSNSTTVLSRIAEFPITPAEAIIKVKSAYFPVTSLTERLSQLDTDPKAFDDVYIGRLYQEPKSTEISFKPTDDVPIRKYGVENSTKGAIEIFEMPQKDSQGRVYSSRYIIGHDPVDNDQAESSSLSSTIVLDLFTDRIVAEYTGRQAYADDNFEIVRLLCLFYNAKCLYESNKKGLYAYFSKLNCTHLLADTPEYLRDKQLVKYSAFGSNAKGVNATAAVNNYANSLIRDWLLKPVNTTIEEDGESKFIQVPNLYFLRNRALIEELIAFNPEINVDRIRALGMVMLYREEKLILYQGNINAEAMEKANANYLGNDDYFSRNYDNRLM
jgi:hypothetical protein